MFSKGFHAQVYDITSETDEHLWVTRADLVRAEHSMVNASLEARRLFYSHRIAHLLFPKNTIEVTGARMEEGCTMLYSKLAPVPIEHAAYSMDTIGYKKESTCLCDACSKHRQFHSENRLEAKALQTARTMEEAGIWVPSEDSTDYCMSHSGDIIFFEHDISVLTVGDFIRTYPDLSIKKQLLEIYLPKQIQIISLYMTI